MIVLSNLVLILIVVEHALGVQRLCIRSLDFVLILIVVEHALGVSTKFAANSY